MTSIKMPQFDASANLLARMPNEIKPHFESILGEATPRREVIDLLAGQMALNLKMMGALVSIAKGDRDAVKTELEELVEVLTEWTDCTTSAITRLMSDDLFRAELGPKDE